MLSENAARAPSSANSKSREMSGIVASARSRGVGTGTLVSCFERNSALAYPQVYICSLEGTERLTVRLEPVSRPRLERLALDETSLLHAARQSPARQPPARHPVPKATSALAQQSPISLIDDVRLGPKLD